MAYMVYQRYTTAVKRGYTGRTDVAAQHQRAIEFRAWLEELEIDAVIRADLVEQARALEHGFQQLARSPTSRG
ncbi:MAG TPA: hypothetical protein VMX12_01625 [Acidimicrobiia bacterium]|nr:hypothetical protein [Acidimicrobiia bacterium]